MNESNTAQRVDRDGLAAHYKDVESFQAARARSANRMSRLVVVVAAISIIANLAQAWTIAAMMPLARIVPVYLWIRQDGTIDSEVSMSKLPASQNQAVIDALLWQYVRNREGYAADTARYSYDLVSELSSPEVRQRYQEYFNYPNPRSPQVVIGRKGTLEVAHISSNDIGQHIQQIRYRRALVSNGRESAASTWTATITYAAVDELPARARLTNPAGIVITAYQATEDSVLTKGAGQ
ncbi:type IV secretion system protein VirB8 [Rhizobium leguminosarum]|uniref:type IV secretion system protein VirB8 n=1 Tax=Rhizobium TaxID=379 RepID=UPI00103148A2|nr:type IV secretion system protein VirB8 [Rhizobium leguminosarum]TBF87510.1 type IV secretion system protein VirB8 [Rhizobium leguminosarum]TBG06986.1 type IV secretion system protein VirB8 [Rhizobium leguminosarum]TBG07857.1 type IV secretion system protein VirB8 [Rhizobium leguminosarum]TBG30023.1 type IV secretion system protein VirB8 [Rhizobium leguminosarum]TBG50156.1 type IV secretion system protein VirB8 [Rhizobium leguminosarum]